MSDNKPKILLIEDEQILAEMYKERFEKEGFEVSLGFDVEESLEKTKKEKPDLIILDIILPRENGISFLKEMRQEPEIKSIPVIALSNFDLPEIKKEAFKLGIKAYLRKTDYTPKALVEEVKKYLPR